MYVSTLLTRCFGGRGAFAELEALCGDRKIIDLSLELSPQFFVGSAEAECIIGTSGPNLIYGGGGSDLIIGKGGDGTGERKAHKPTPLCSISLLI